MKKSFVFIIMITISVMIVGLILFREPTLQNNCVLVEIEKRNNPGTDSSIYNERVLTSVYTDRVRVIVISKEIDSSLYLDFNYTQETQRVDFAIINQTEFTYRGYFKCDKEFDRDALATQYENIVPREYIEWFVEKYILE